MHARRKALRKRKVYGHHVEPHSIFRQDIILMEIFKNLPSLKSVNLVCKQFYRVAMTTQKGAWQWIRNEFDIDDIELYDSMVHTKRIIENVSLGESSGINTISCYDNIDEVLLNEKWYFTAVRTIFIAHGKHIKQVQLMNVEISIDNLLELLNYTSNLKLQLFFVHENGKSSRIKKYSKETLPKIANLIIYECNPSMSLMIKYLPENSIKSLTIKTNDLEGLVLRYQSSIVKMNLTYDGDSPTPIDLLASQRLTHLTLNVKKDENLFEIFSQQIGLKILDSLGTVIDHDTFNAITKLPHLEKLMVNLSGISHSVFSSISRLKCLKSLTLKNLASRHLSTLKQCDLMLDKVNFVGSAYEVSMVQAVERKLMHFKSKSC